jgi:hypothetical protein
VSRTFFTGRSGVSGESLFCPWLLHGDRKFTWRCVGEASTY